MVKKNIPNTIIREITREDQSSSTSSTTQNPTNNSRKNNNFIPHKYETTDFAKYHNQSKETLLISKRLQKVKTTLSNGYMFQSMTSFQKPKCPKINFFTFLFIYYLAKKLSVLKLLKINSNILHNTL